MLKRCILLDRRYREPGVCEPRVPRDRQLQGCGAASNIINAITTTTRVTVTNQPPYVPSNPSPPNGATGVPLTQTLSWQGGDPDSDPVTYTVAISASDLPLVVATTTLTRYTPTLITATTYYWGITASDGISTSVGPTWHFTTVGFKYIYLPLVLRQ